MFYATIENDGDAIYDSACISAFKTETEAREWLLSFLDPREWKKDEAVIKPGHFGDCWIKTYSEPHTFDGQLFAGTFDCEPFTADQLHIAAPSQHPDGRCWWITPRVEVLVISQIEPIEE